MSGWRSDDMHPLTGLRLLFQVNRKPSAVLSIKCVAICKFSPTAEGISLQLINNTHFPGQAHLLTALPSEIKNMTLTNHFKVRLEIEKT
jgi:hypothetical protein